ncbi:MAG TPA: glycosyltransferase [Paracoccaceae bacterium]|nr:glycosyltransferase [Paracoccaceae bacterium]
MQTAPAGARLRQGPAGAVAALLLVTALALAWAVTLGLPPPEGIGPFLTTVGIIAAWRYGWWLTHALRAAVYLRRVFPAIRRKADAAAPFPAVQVMVLSYDIPPAEFCAVYRALIRNAVDYGAQTTIIASVTAIADRARLEAVWRDCGAPPRVTILTQFQAGDGKRSAMAMAMRALARRAPAPDTPVVFMDGDIVLRDGALRGALSVLAARPDIDAVTTNNDASVTGGHLVRQWYALRYAQRHITMASMALSSRLLVLTGRFSVFRARDALDPGMIAAVAEDSIDHWRLGRFRFLSGDDKSTWLFLMRRGARMLYVPDAWATGFEALPKGGRVFAGTTDLMRRWFGNMLRANSRALALGPRRMGLFTWWALLDQRLSMWSTLFGPVAAGLFALTQSPLFLIYYATWALSTRSLMAGLSGLMWGRFDGSWPLLMYYNQVWGSALKVYLTFRLDRQSWSRQAITSSGSAAGLSRWSTRMMTAAALASFVYAVTLMTSVMPMAGPAGLATLTLSPRSVP